MSPPISPCSPLDRWTFQINGLVRQPVQWSWEEFLLLPSWDPHLPGQHYDIRLTAPDGYQTERSYSIASEPEREGEIDLTIERLEDGEVSPYLDDVMVMGDQIELRGMIGGYFVWEARMGGRCSW